MTALPATADVVIVGAGLAGLSAAVHLMRAGIDVQVVERDDTVGGRVRTDVIDGMRLDRGFQVLATAYPDVRRLIDLSQLDPRPFVPGVGLGGGGRIHRIIDPRHEPTAVREALIAPIGSIGDRIRLARYVAALMAESASEILRRPEMPAGDAFRAAGLSQRAVDRALRPFLRGVVLENELATSRRFVDLALRSMLQGPVVIPARGMQQLPDVIARLLPPDRLHVSTQVRAVAGTVVQTDDGAITGRCVVVATDPAAASSLLPGVEAPPMRGVTTLYHRVQAPPMDEALLVVDAERGVFANSVVLTAATDALAPAGTHLVSTSVLGVGHDLERLDRRVRERLGDLHQASTDDWLSVHVAEVAHAVPAMPAPHVFRRPIEHAPGVFVAGDHRDSGSIQGALASGRRTADAVADYLGSPTAA